MIIKGITQVTGYQKHVHVLVESSPKCMSVFVPGNTSELRSGGSSVSVVLSNLSGRDITLEAHTEVGTVTAANIVHSMQVSSEPNRDEKEMLQYMSTQVESSDVSEGFQQGSTNPEGILTKHDLSRIDDWSAQIQQEAQDLICEYACIFHEMIWI